jgi:hypothetical protein
MTDTQHPITPPTELVQLWRAAASNVPATLATPTDSRRDYIDFIATQAARWAADQELDACCAEISWLDSTSVARKLRDRRRPKPTSLKEQALKALKRQAVRSVPSFIATEDFDTIRRALEQLDD